MGPKAILDALALGSTNMIMTAVLLVAVGLIINVVAMTGIGNTISLMIAQWSGNNLLIALLLIALASLILGMGLPVTASYIVLATLSAPALHLLIQNNYLIDVMMAGQIPEGTRVIFSLVDPGSDDGSGRADEPGCGAGADQCCAAGGPLAGLSAGRSMRM